MNPRWFSETLYPDFQQSFQITDVLYEGRTEFQDVIVFTNPRFGRVMALDGIIQITEKDEFCYHEMITHVPMVAHGAARRVLIIGGGDGGVLREALRHPVERVTMIELDDAVVRLCREYMPSVSNGAFDDERTDLRFMDGIKFVAETDDRFDVIVVDSTDPIGPGEVLFTDAFYADCARCLTESGILVTQSGVTFMQEDEATATWRRMNRLFADASLFVTQVPTYGAGFMTLGWGCHSRAPRATPLAEIARRVETLGLTGRYYSPAAHAASFAVPAYIENLMRD